MSFHVMTDEQVILLGKTIASEVLKGSGQISADDTDDVLSRKDAAKKYEVNERTITAMFNRKELKGYKAGRNLYIYKNQ